jgi:type IX secretion system PorP/SprF family membrane protein
MKKRILIITILLQFAFVGLLKAQVDPHFSQYYAYPLWLNPALTGVFDGDARLTGNFKDQWASINNGYRTVGLSADFKPTDKVGLGFNVINQAAGAAGYNYFAAYGSFGYGITISDDETQHINFGLQAGLINRSFDPNKIQLDNQYNPNVGGYDPNLPGFENFVNAGATVFDAGAGIFYYDSDQLTTANPFLGLSVAHLTNAKDPFATEGINSRLPVRLNIHGGVRIKASDFFDVTPHFIYVKQQKNQIRAGGLYTELKFPDNNALIIGGMFRLQDAAVANVGYHFNNMVIGASYDFNTSALRTATAGQGGFELSISYTFSHHAPNPARVCPRF